eukprot:scaffold1690_cov182-Amphora_coffeaeformis.AAC.26
MTQVGRHFGQRGGTPWIRQQFDARPHQLFGVVHGLLRPSRGGHLGDATTKYGQLIQQGFGFGRMECFHQFDHARHAINQNLSRRIRRYTIQQIGTPNQQSSSKDLALFRFLEHFNEMLHRRG